MNAGVYTGSTYKRKRGKQRKQYEITDMISLILPWETGILSFSDSKWILEMSSLFLHYYTYYHSDFTHETHICNLYQWTQIIVKLVSTFCFLFFLKNIGIMEFSTFSLNFRTFSLCVRKESQ